MKKKVLIFFPNHHLAYSPSTINLYKCLETKFDVQIIAPYPSRFDNKELKNFKVDYFKDDSTGIWIKFLALILLPVKNLYHFFRQGIWVYKYATLKPLIKYNSIFRKYAAAHQDSIVVAVDISFFKIAVKHFRQVHFLSLELTDELKPILKAIDDRKIGSVLIQTMDRYNYLFAGRDLKVFLIQNSNFFQPGQGFRGKRPDTVIFNGTATANFGVFYFLEFIRENSNRFTGIIKGAILSDVRKKIEDEYQGLIKSGHLILDSGYHTSDSLVEYISAFEIGICFYDMKAFKKDRFNYLTAPSGKMFTYFASGVPVVGSNIPGLKIIEDFGAGILIDEYSAESILKAVDTIKEDYKRFSENCLHAASWYSFEKHAEAFVNFLEQNNRKHV